LIDSWASPLSVAERANRCARRRKRSYTPRHGELAVPALRHAPAGGIPVLGLFAILDELLELLALPARRRGHPGHLRR